MKITGRLRKLQARRFGRSSGSGASPPPATTCRATKANLPRKPTYEFYLIKLFPVNDVVHPCWVAHLTVALVQRHVFAH
jgi:hypothetical protein